MSRDIRTSWAVCTNYNTFKPTIGNFLGFTRNCIYTFSGQRSRKGNRFDIACNQIRIFADTAAPRGYFEQIARDA